MSTTRSRLHGRLSLVLASALASGSLALGGLVAFAPAASAEQTGQPVAGTGVATWGVSDLLGTARTGIPSPVAASYDAPATYDGTAKVSTWGNGSGTVAADGSADLTFAGSSLSWTPTGNAWVRLANLEAEFDADGDGQVTAEVSYGTTTAGDLSTASVKRGPARVKIVDLYSTDPDPATYPDSLENLAYSFSADADSYDWAGLTGRWAPELATFLAGDAGASIPGYIYASTFQNGAAATGSTAGVLRWPAELKLSVARAVAQTEVTAALNGGGIDLDVAGTGFKQTAPGLYVSLRARTAGDAAYAGGSVQAGAPTAWVSNDPADIGSGPTGAAGAIAADGSFDATISIDATTAAALDPTKTYTVVTRKAHGQGGLPANADQVTETPVDIAGLKELTTAAATADPVAVGTDSVVDVTVTGAEGGTPTGEVKLLENGTQVGNADLNGSGTATITLSGLTAGTHTLAVAYQGGNAFWKSTGSVQVVVDKAASSLTVAGPASVGYRTAATYVATVSQTGGTGTGTVTVTGAGAAKVLTVSGGTASYTLPADLAAGTKALTFTYSGDAATTGTTATRSVVVAKGATSTTLKRLVKATKKKAGRYQVTVTSLRGGTAPTGKVSVVLTKGKAKRTVAGKVLANGKVVITLPKVAKGAWKLTFAYSGSGNHLVSSRATTIVVK